MHILLMTHVQCKQFEWGGGGENCDYLGFYLTWTYYPILNC